MTERELEGQLATLADLSDNVQHQKKKPRQRIRIKMGDSQSWKDISAYGTQPSSFP